jgi:hypothetical protein
MAASTEKKPFFGYRGGWLTFWITVSLFQVYTLGVSTDWMRLRVLRI